MLKLRAGKVRIQQVLPYILIIGAVIGLVASFVLTIEHINVYKDPNHKLSCSLDPVVNCGPIMSSKEATVFGFPNPLIGLVIFGAQAAIGFAMLAGARLKRWFWIAYAGGVLLGDIFTIWLIWHSLYVIGAICIYCFAVWNVMLIVSWYLFQFMLAEKHINVPLRTKAFVRKHHGDILIVFYIIFFGLILHRFWFYYGPKLGL